MNRVERENLVALLAVVAIAGLVVGVVLYIAGRLLVGLAWLAVIGAAVLVIGLARWLDRRGG